MESYYANIVAYRLTVNELVLDFGNFFHGQYERDKPDDEDLHIRVVMAPTMIPLMLEALQKIQAEHERLRTAESSKTEKSGE